jgi:hypothetical protein
MVSGLTEDALYVRPVRAYSPQECALTNEEE